MSGKASRNPGKDFEDQFKKSLDDYKKEVEGYTHRLPDSPMSFNKQLQQMTRFTIKNPFDYLGFFYPNFFGFELKSTQGTSLSIAQNNSKEEEKKMIKYHQIEGLREVQRAKGGYGGFVFNFRSGEHRDEDATYYMNIEDFDKWLKSTNKSSINEKDVSFNGGILIQQEKIRVKYNFNIEKLISNIIIWCNRNKKEN